MGELEYWLAQRPSLSIGAFYVNFSIVPNITLKCSKSSDHLDCTELTIKRVGLPLRAAHRLVCFIACCSRIYRVNFNIIISV